MKIVGLIGRDDYGAQVKEALRGAAASAIDGIVVDESRPTTRKMRVVTSRNQQVARIDYESDARSARRRGGRAAGRAGRGRGPPRRRW